jgi:hypothetical protein
MNCGSADIMEGNGVLAFGDLLGFFPHYIGM